MGGISPQTHLCHLPSLLPAEIRTARPQPQSYLGSDQAPGHSSCLQLQLLVASPRNMMNLDYEGANTLTLNFATSRLHIRRSPKGHLPASTGAMYSIPFSRPLWP